MKKNIGLVEKIRVKGKKTIEALALMDTGAFLTSMDIELAKKAGLGPPHRTTTVRSASVRKKVERPVVSATLMINGKKFNAEVNLQDRSHMTFPLIIGRNILCGNFIVDPEKNLELLLSNSKKKK